MCSRRSPIRRPYGSSGSGTASSDRTASRSACARWPTSNQIGETTADEAELIGGTYLDDTTLADYAQRTSQPRWSLYKRRVAAVARLTAAIGSGELSDPYADVIAEATLTVVPESTSHRRRP